MTAKNFDAAFKRVLVYEGGKVDDPRDPGGRTNLGVTQRVYDAWRRRQGKSVQDVYKITLVEAKAIYRVQYWDAVRGDQLPDGVDLVVYDGSVNSGPKQSIKWLQAALCAKGASIPVDGEIGQVTLDAAANNTDDDLLIAEISARRLGFLKRLKTWKTFGKGWGTRVANVTKAGQALASGSVGPKPVSVTADGGHQKAMADDLKTPMLSMPAAASATTGSATLAGVSDAVNGAAGQVQVVADASETLKYVFIALTVIGVLLTLYVALKIRKSDKARDAEARG